METPSRVLLESYYNPVGKFPCATASSTPIRVVTKEVRYIHELSLTLEHFMPISSPAAPGLTGLEHLIASMQPGKYSEDYSKRSKNSKTEQRNPEASESTR